MSIVIADYDPEWPSLFERLKANILNGMGALVVAVEHVGSTSVPGLAAKPIVDMNVLVEAQNKEAAIRALAKLGYRHQNEARLQIGGREAFEPPAGEVYHHFYLWTLGSQGYNDQIMFRDYLRVHPEDAERYAALKRKSAILYGDDRTAYSESKTELVQELLRRAKELQERPAE